MCSTRPDIAFAVSYLSRQVQKPQTQRLIAAKRVLRYLKGTMNMGLHFGSEQVRHQPILLGWCDSDWAGDCTSRKSTSGYLWHWRGNTVSWASQIQKTVALSSAEAELIGMVEAIKEMKWVHLAIVEVFQTSSDSPTPGTLLTDSQSAIAITERQGTVHCVRHMDIRHHFSRDLMDLDHLKIEYTLSSAQVADTLTKPLDRQFFAHS